MLQYEVSGTTSRQAAPMFAIGSGRPKVRQSFEALIIDDNPADQKLIEIHLKKAFSGNASVSSAATLDEGLQALEFFHFDVVFLDLGLPESTGPCTVTEVANKFPHVPIVVITGQDDLIVVQEAIRRGAQEFLSKNNLNSGGISAAVHHAIERHKMYSQMEVLISKNADAIMVVSFEGTIKFANQAAYKLFGAEGRELLDQRFDCSSFGTGRTEVELSFMDSGMLTLEVSNAFIHWQGARSYLVTLHDISSHKEREIQLRKERERAISVSETKSKFLANMSHELRTPLNAIIGFSEIILTDVGNSLPEAKTREYIKDINTCGHTLLTQVNDLLDIAKAEANKLTLLIEETSVQALLHEAVSAIKVSAGAKNISIQVDCPDAEQMLKCDAHRIGQVLRNLCSNAVKFTDNGGAICVMARDQIDYMLFGVIDTGCGIADHDLERVFEPFSQVDSDPHRRRTQGSGLGLSIARHLVELHGGSIELESELGFGTAAYFKVSKFLKALN
jgi:signal transduction histidine kinase